MMSRARYGLSAIAVAVAYCTIPNTLLADDPPRLEIILPEGGGTVDLEGMPSKTIAVRVKVNDGEFDPPNLMSANFDTDLQEGASSSSVWSPASGGSNEWITNLLIYKPPGTSTYKVRVEISDVDAIVPPAEAEVEIEVIDTGG